MVCIHTENQNQGDFYPFVLLEISVLYEPPLGHLRYGLTDVPPQPNSPPDYVFNLDHRDRGHLELPRNNVYIRLKSRIRRFTAVSTRLNK